MLNVREQVIPTAETLRHRERQSERWSGKSDEENEEVREKMNRN